VVMDNLGCVFIMGGVVLPFATGGRAWGEFVSGGSPNPDLQRLEVHMLDLQVKHQFSLTFGWVPRDLNVERTTCRTCPRCDTTTTASRKSGSPISTGSGASTRSIGSPLRH
jgi:hypothetical protein